jgi:hypothetical protein
MATTIKALVAVSILSFIAAAIPRGPADVQVATAPAIVARLDGSALN